MCKSDEQQSGTCGSQPILFGNFNEIIYRLDERSVITHISSALGHLTGYTPEEILGRPFSDFVHPDDLTGRLEQLNKVLYGEYFGKIAKLQEAAPHIPIHNNPLQTRSLSFILFRSR